jgi:hypothetical protein
MANHNFWRGEKVRMRAIEQKDLDEILVIKRNRIAGWIAPTARLAIPPGRKRIGMSTPRCVKPKMAHLPG